MDQIRAIVGFLWRERFWVLTTIGTIVAVACWYVSATDLDKQFASRKGQINGTFSSTSNLAREADHPNDDVIEGNKIQARRERDNVLAIWQRLYDEQREEVLKWPADSLKPEFIQTIEGLKFRDPFPASLEQNMRNEYANYIGTRLDDLLKIVEAPKMEDRGARGGGGGRSFSMDFEDSPYGSRGSSGEDEEEEEDYIVEWFDQGNLREKLDFEERKPTALQIWVTQEDLWVYETLLHVIANTNKAKGATRPGNAAVKVILTLEVGREAALASRESSQIIMPSSSSTGGEGMFDGEGMYDGMGMGGGGRYGEGRGEYGGGMYGEEEEMDDSQVLAMRYLMEDGQPYEGEPEDPEFRRLPIHMVLMMDQRWLPALTVQCANASLPVEVTQVKVNPELSGGDFGSATGGGRRGSSEAFSGGGGRRRQTTTTSEDNPNLSEVEIHGVVYIYNQPDEEVLSLPGLDEPGEEDGQLADADTNF